MLQNKKRDFLKEIQGTLLIGCKLSKDVKLIEAGRDSTLNKRSKIMSVKIKTNLTIQDAIHKAAPYLASTKQNFLLTEQNLCLTEHC